MIPDKPAKTADIKFWEIVSAGPKKSRILSEFETPDGRRFGFYFAGTAAKVYSSTYGYVYSLEAREFRSGLSRAEFIEHLRTTFKLDPLDSAFGWLIVCCQAVQKMVKAKKGSANREMFGKTKFHMRPNSKKKPFRIKVGKTTMYWPKEKKDAHDPGSQG